MARTTLPIDPLAHHFDKVADAYDRGRPEYAAAAIAHLAQVLGLGPGATVLDLAAGTGKLTRQLVPTGARVIAVEPVAGMRAKLQEVLPDVTALEGTAEAIPLPNASVDVVTVAQAFHWFRGPEALAEMRRVLRPGGGLAILWNVADDTVEWMTQIAALVEPHEVRTPRPRTGAWKQAFDTAPGFSALEVARFPSVTAATPDQVVDRIRSASFVAALPEADRARLLAGVRRVLSEHPLTRGRERVSLSHVSEVYTCRRT